MCGVSGIVDLNGKPVPAGPVIREMTRALTHRGPDDEGYLEDRGVVLGHRRLKVIDLEGGRQPMTSQDGRYSIVFNGEIYNFTDIRRRLEEAGRRFVTRSDTESLLQLFEEKGVDALKEIEGMFAFAVWDRAEETATLAIDPFGKKPLYYTVVQGRLIFASEIKALLKHPDVVRDIDTTALSEYLAFEYVPAPRTLFRGIQKLEAGQYLRVKDAQVEVIRYHRHDYTRVPASEAESVEVLTHHLKTSVARRLVADVPLGVFLSGGVDSSAVLAMVREIYPGQPIKSFTIRFEEPSFDESVHARKVASHFGTEHIEESCSVEDMLKEHARILTTLDEPLADGSYIPTFMLCRLARRHVTVALSGDGGDEVFGGYPTFLADRGARMIAGCPRPLIGLLDRMVQRLPTSMENISWDFRLKQFFKGLPYEGAVRNQVWLGAFSDREIETLLAAGTRREGKGVYDILRTPRDRVSTDTFRQIQDFYFRFYLQGDILVKVDRASMANSLEVRSPLLDDRFTRLSLGLDSSLLVRHWTTKHIFKKLMRSRLPDAIADRPKKGFGIPIAHWIRNGLRGEFQRTLDPARIRRDGLFEPGEVKRLLAEHLAGKRDNRKKLWTLYVFHKWKEHWLDR